jgi:hypothetical protein
MIKWIIKFILNLVVEYILAFFLIFKLFANYDVALLFTNRFIFSPTMIFICVVIAIGVATSENL